MNLLIRITAGGNRPQAERERFHRFQPLREWKSVFSRTCRSHSGAFWPEDVLFRGRGGFREALRGQRVLLRGREEPFLKV